ncbi:DUF4212 domain-containing protein [Pyruvatibacter sp.]|uniref:DUF4212 domain-containing protein n=1 Tax=Pyruvatibacter sp. TaxID=1981328 RepID=UPI0032ECFC59
MSTPQNGGGDGKPAVYHHEGGNMPAHDHHDTEVLSEASVRGYWHANLQLLGVLLAVWFIVSFGFGILFAEPLNSIQFFGFKLGFWWAQQGSIYVFIALIAIYVVAMKRIDRRYGVDDD